MKTSRNLLIAATILFCGTTCVNANAQTASYSDTRHEIGVTVGVGTTTQFIHAIANFAAIAVEATATTAATAGAYTGYEYGESHDLPAFSVEYYYHIDPVIGIGGYVAYNGTYRDMYFNWRDNNSGEDHSENFGKAWHHNISVIPTVKFDWFSREHFGLYSKAGFGISIMCETQKDDNSDSKNEKSTYTETSVFPNMELTFIGFEAGNHNWRGFAEFGFGEQGIYAAGLRYKF